MISFQKYVSEMQEYQKNIFYIAGESIETLKNSPFIEELVNRNYDILLLTDPLDEYVFQQITNYNNKDLVCITKENAKLGDIKNLYSKNSFEKLCIYIKKCLDDDILKVIISNLLIDSPCVLATNKYSWSANMQRIMKAQTLRNYKENFNTKKIMKINPNHPLIIKLNESINRKVFNKKFVDETIKLIYETSLLTSGFNLENPTKFSNKIYNVLNNNFNSNKKSTL